MKSIAVAVHRNKPKGLAKAGAARHYRSGPPLEDGPGHCTPWRDTIPPLMSRSGHAALCLETVRECAPRPNTDHGSSGSFKRSRQHLRRPGACQAVSRTDTRPGPHDLAAASAPQ